MMACYMNLGKSTCESVKLESTTCHLMPCKINHRGKSAVSKYFTSNIRKKEDESVLSCSFRGHPLYGTEIQVPKGHLGVVLEEIPENLKPDGNRELNMIGAFRTFTSWNWDQIPSSDDKLIQALDWIDVSVAIHKPIDSKVETEDEHTVAQTLSQRSKRTLSDSIG